MLSGFAICNGEAYPLWLVAPVASGGLGWSASQVGSLQAMSGFFLAASNFLLFPLVSKRVPSTTLFQVCSGLSAVIIASTPLIAPIGGRFPSLLMPLLLLHSSVKEFCSSTCFTAVFLVINNSCTKGQRGRVNGLGMSLSSAFKAVGPTLGSVSFAWSLTNGYGFPLDVHFTFLLCGIFAAATCAVACRSFSAE